MSDDEILTIRDVAALLKVGEKAIYTMAQAGDLPGFKVRGQWRFRRSDIDAWIAAQVEHAKARPDDDGGGDE
ncbi:MAG TPA: DNA-binding protein [Myxococcales bacterium]|nr:DNA-binding protein [Myxococcales bacterium]